MQSQLIRTIDILDTISKMSKFYILSELFYYI